MTERQRDTQNRARDHVAMITGGTRGIGRATALRLAERKPGHIILGYNSNHQAARDVVSELQEMGVESTAYALDVGNADMLSEMFEWVTKRFGRLDVFVSCAARTTFRSALDINTRNWERVQQLNSSAFLLSAQHCRALMKDRGGHIVALSSLGSRFYLPNYAALGAAKATIEALVRFLAVEMAPDNIRVNGVCGGFIDTDSTRLLPDFDAISKEIAHRTPVGRIGFPDDLAKIVAFLSSPEADWIRGQTLVADGGYSIVG